MTDCLQMKLMLDVAAFRIFGTKKFPPGGQVIKKRAHLDLRSGRFTSIAHFRRATALPRHAIERLAQADAFSSLGLSRRQALWRSLITELTIPSTSAWPTRR